ncbi:MAG: DMT family transporter [Betaproteobacteria bacterium]|nr:DMT family transporter [Betaproteobacteria bacterium]
MHADSARNRLLGIGLISITILCFAVLEAGAKWLVRSLPVMEAVFLRFSLHFLFTTALLAPRHGLALVRTRRPWLQLARGCFLPVMTGMNFWALQYLQLAETGAIQFTVPILIALFAAPLLGERLDRARWIAILVGFIGVLVIIRPGTQGFHPALLLALANAVLYALFNLLTRHLAAYDSAEATQFIAGAVAVVTLAPFAFAVWQTPQGWLPWAVAVLIGIAGGMGHYLLALAHRYAPASVLGPFLYQQIIWMVLLGYLVFGDLPAAPVVLGCAIVVASGGYLLWRERRSVKPAA